MENTKEDFEAELFPNSKSMKDFEELVSHIQEKLSMFNATESGKRDILLVKQFFEKLRNMQIFDIVKDRLHEDRFYLTKKIDQGSSVFDDLVENWDSSERIIPVEKLCQAYAYSFERFCKVYLKPLASKISKQNINECGKALEIIIKYDSNLKSMSNYVVPQIRNSIDHVDYFHDKKSDKIIFSDREKNPIELDYEELKLNIHRVMNIESIFSCAEDEMKMSLYKTIIEDTKKTFEYCKILSIDFDQLLDHFLKKGKSIFEIKFSLEQLIKMSKN